jgi:hypothetical protein
MRSPFKTGRVASGDGVITFSEDGMRMRAGQGFGRWGFILGNVLVAFGAPVFVTSLVATVAAGRAGTAARGADIAAIAAGAVFMIAGLIATVAAGRARQLAAPAPQPEPPAVERVPPRVTHRPSAIEPLPLTLNTLDDYYAQSDGSDGGLALADSDFYTEPYQAPRAVPRPRNARGNMSGDRFCEPSATVTRSSGTRRRPQGG